MMDSIYIVGSLNGVVTEDKVTSAKGRAEITDSVLAGKSGFEEQKSLSGRFGSFSIDPFGNWEYVLDSSLKSLQGLRADQVEKESFIINWRGLYSSLVTINVVGTNDIPAIDGDLSRDLIFGREQVVGGSLVIMDADVGQSIFLPAVGMRGAYGSLSIQTNGRYDYQPDGDAVSRLYLKAGGPMAVDLFDVTSIDGTRCTIKINLSVESEPGRISVIQFSPRDGATAVMPDRDLTLTFNVPVQRSSGAIILKTSSGQAVETFSTGNSIFSGHTLTLKPSRDLNIFTKYIVELQAGAVRDLSGNGNAADSRYDFQTATLDGLYHFFVVAFAAAPGATYMSQLAEAVNFGLPLNEIVEIFTTKTQFTSVYPTTMSNRELATQLVNNIVKNSASAATKQAAIDDIDAALGIGWSRGKMLYTVFGNLASKPLTDPVWGGTAKQFQNQLAVARYFTEEMGVATENLATLRSVIGSVTPDTDVSSVDKIVQIIGTVPPGG